jgi:hypothetical protein
MKPANVICGLAATALVAVLTGGPASAEDFPPRKAGLWVIDMTTGGKASPHQMQICIDSATDAEMYRFGMNAARGMCDKQEVSRSGDIVTVDSSCAVGQSRVTTHAVITYDGDTAYHTESKSTFDPAMMGQSESTTTQDAKWKGPCPADMEPGDMIMGKGMKMNIKKMMNILPAK